MRIMNGQTITVWRQKTTRDRHGDVEREVVGTIDHVVFQWASAASVGLRFQPSRDFRESSELGAVMFIPRDAELKVNAKDRVEMNGSMFQVIGSRAWDEIHPATGHDYGVYMIQVEMVE